MHSHLKQKELTMSLITLAPESTSTRSTARWVAPALIAAAAVNVIAEAVVASAWDRRPYSYVEDYVNFLGSPFAGDLQGVTISSPLWWLMSIAWIVTGTLIAAAGISLSRRLSGKRRRITAGLALTQGVALVLFAVFPLGPATMANGFTLTLYLLGAFGSIIAGNALAITVGLSGRALGLPRWLATSSIVIGAIGLLNIPLTYGWTPTGVAERISVYSYLLWALVTGIVLLRARRTPIR